MESNGLIYKRGGVMIELMAGVLTGIVALMYRVFDKDSDEDI